MQAVQDAVFLNQSNKNHRFTLHEEGDSFGRQQFMCYNCLKHICLINCAEELESCVRCEKSFCEDIA